MIEQPRNRGPWTHRALIWVFAVALGFLIYWLLGFVVNDIATWPGPAYETIEQEMLDPALLREEAEIAREHDTIQAKVRERESRQRLLRDSTESSQQTMNQLIGIYRLGLEKNVEPTEAEQNALAEA